MVERSPEILAKQPWLKVYDEQTPNSVPQLAAGLEIKTPEIQQIVLEQVLKVRTVDSVRDGLRQFRPYVGALAVTDRLN